MVSREREDGIGIRNTRARLEQLYGSEQSMSFYDVPPRGITARIQIPVRRASSTVGMEVKHRDRSSRADNR